MPLRPGPRSRRRILRSTIVVGTVLGLCVTVGTAGFADDSPAVKPGTTAEKYPFSSISAASLARMRAQQPYSAGARLIQQAALRADATGYSGIGISPTAVQVWWKGTVPDEVLVAVDAARTSVAVDVIAAPFSRAELETEATRFADAMAADSSSSLYSIEIPVDGSRVIAVYEPGSKSLVDGARTLWTSHTLGRRAVDTTSSAGIPVEVVERPRQHLACGPPTRYNDGWAGNSCNGATFSGGGALVNPEVPGSGCTAGYGVADGYRTFILTAGHCGRSGGPMNNGNNSRQLGYGFAEHVAHDLLLIEAPADNWMWDGPTWAGFTKSVAFWDWVYPGENICLSGAVTGAFCDIHNTSNFVFQLCDYDVYGYWECYNDLISVENSPEIPYLSPCQDGDSGAPIFVVYGSYSVVAKGTLTSCGFGGLSYQDFATAVADFGIYALT